MNLLENFKNIHEDQDIYVVGAGKSCDFIPNSFFDGKVVIGVNQSYKKIIPNYLVRKEALLADRILRLPQLENTVHFISKGDCGDDGDANEVFLQKYYENNDKVVAFDHLVNGMRNVIFPENPNALVVSWSTITSAIHLAAYMGAKNIILVGHDCGKLDGDCFFSGYHTDESIGINWGNTDDSLTRYENWLSKIETQTLDLRELLKHKYGCNIVSLNPFINIGLEGHKYEK